MRADTATIWRAGERRPGHQVARLHLRDGERLGVDEILLGNRDDAARDPQQPADGEVLARLRHHRLVGGDDQQHGVDAADPGQHVLDETLVSRHVDEREIDVANLRVRESRGRW